MRLRLFLIAAIALIVFGIIAGASKTPTLTLFGVQWFIWFMAAFLSFLVDIATGGWGYASGAWGRDSRGNPVP